jgi:Domain of unknown function (DUF4328)/Protein of unknown function (DUF2510)
MRRRHRRPIASINEMTEGPPAGWYPDPNDPDRSRYWNGSAWTAYTGPLEGDQDRPPPPKPFSDTGAAAADAAREPPKPLHATAWWAYSVLAFSVMANALYTVLALIYAGKVQTQIDVHSLTLQQAEDAENAFNVGGTIWLISLVAGGIGFLVWWYRAYSNLPALTGHSRRFGRGWSIGAWFVPILSLWRPKQIGNDIWRGGDPEARGNERWTSLPVSPLVHWWWAIYILGGFIGAIAGAMLGSDSILSNSVTAPGLLPVADPPSHADLVQEHSAAIAIAVSNVIGIAAAVLAVLFVKKASERQDRAIAATEPTEATT